MSFAAVQEFEVSTGVEYSCSGHFLDRNVLHLVIAGGASLELYEFVPQGSSSGYYLRFVRGFDFFGTIQSLEKVPPEAFENVHLRPDCDALLVAFDYGKFSIVQFDAFGSSMETLEIIDMEDKPYNQSRYRVNCQGQGKGTHMSALTTVRIDPDFRCCATLLYDSQLCIFPFLGKFVPRDSSSVDSFGQAAAELTAAADAAAGLSGVGGIGHPDARRSEDLRKLTVGTAGIGSGPRSDVFVAASGGGGGSEKRMPLSELDNNNNNEAEEEEEVQCARLINGVVQFSLTELGVDGAVLDAVFLDGYFQPTLLILHQPLATGNPLLYMRKNTFVATLVTFDLARRTFASVWRLDDLPHDSLQLVPVPKVDGTSGSSSSNGGGPSPSRSGAEGAILVTTNSLYYLHPRYCSGAHLNGFSDFSAGKLTAQFPVTRYHFGATLDAARCLFVRDSTDGSRQKMLVAKRDGLMSVLTLVPNPVQPASVARLHISIAARITVPCCLSLLGSSHVFVGSRMGDSQLLAYEYKSSSSSSSSSAAAAAAGSGASPTTRQNESASSEAADAPMAKRARVPNPLPAVGEPLGADIDEDTFLYGTAGGGGGGGRASATTATPPDEDGASGHYHRDRGQRGLDGVEGSTESGRSSVLPSKKAAAAATTVEGVGDAMGVTSTGGSNETGLAIRAVDWLESRATGPVVSASLGNVGDVYSDEFEMLVAAGKDKCGALYKIRHGLHAECLSTIVDDDPAPSSPYLRVAAFSTCLGESERSADEGGSNSSSGLASYIVLGSATSTLVLRAGEGALVNVEKPGTPFTLSDEGNGVHRSGGETLAIAPILSGRRVVQVYQQQVSGSPGSGEDRKFAAGIRLLDAALGPLQEILVHDDEDDGGIGIDHSVGIRSAVVGADSFCALLFDDGGIKILYADEDDELCVADPEGLVPPDVDDEDEELEEVSVDGADGNAVDDDDDDQDSDDEMEPAEITAFSFFELPAADAEATFLTGAYKAINSKASEMVSHQHPPALSADEVLLYGSRQPRAAQSSAAEGYVSSQSRGGSLSSSSEAAPCTGSPGISPGEKSQRQAFCTIGWSDGNVQVYRISARSPRFSLVFQCRGIADAEPILENVVDSHGRRHKLQGKRRRPPAKVIDTTFAPLRDCTGFDTYVLAATLDTGALRVYEVCRKTPASQQGQGHPFSRGMCLSRVAHRHVVHEGPRRHSGLRRSRAAAALLPEVEEEPHSGFRPQTLTCFDGIGNRTGIFHCSRGRAAWIIVARGAVRVLSHNNSTFSRLGRLSGSMPDGLGNSVVSFSPVVSAALFGEADPHGFVACSRRGHVGLFQLPDDLPPDAYREELTVGRCATLKCTPHHVVYLHKAAVDRKPVPFIVRRQRRTGVDVKPYYAVACAQLVAYAPAKLKVVDPRLDVSVQRRELCTPSKKFGTPRVWVEQHFVKLMRDGAECVGQFKLNEFEHVLTMEILHLRDSKFMPTRPFLAVGTAYQKKAAFHAEAAGRLILLGLGMSPDDGPPGKGGAPGATATGGSGGGDPKNKSKGGNTAAASSAGGGAATSTTTTKNAYERTCSDPCMVMEYAFELDLNAPCSAICQVADHVVVGMGPKIRVYRWYKRELEQCGFYDSRIHTVSLRAVKDTYVALADVAFSVQFLKWEEPQTTVVVKSEDQQHLPVYAADFIVQGRKLGVVASDACRNLQILEYAPQDLRSGHKGHKLLTPAATHLGSHVAVLEPQDLRACRYQGEGRGAPKNSSSSSSVAADADAGPSLNGLLYATLDGGFGSIVPIPERDFRRLERLQRQMASRALGHLAGCNPRYFREYRQGERGEVRVHDRPMLDGRLLWKFADLDAATQQELAYHSGDADVDVLLSNLAEMRSLAGF